MVLLSTDYKLLSGVSIAQTLKTALYVSIASHIQIAMNVLS